MGIRWHQEHTLLTSAEREVSGQSNVKNVGEYKEAVFFLIVTAITGSGATLKDFRLQYSTDNATWYDSAFAFTPLTATGRQAMPVSVLGTYIRFDYAISGASPKITFSLKGSFKS